MDGGPQTGGCRPGAVLDQRFVTYTIAQDGRPAVTSADGTTPTGELLVGADGSNSRVRRQYLPHIARKDLGILNVAGRLSLDRPAAAELPPAMLDSSINNIVPAGPGWLFVSTWALPAGAAAGADCLGWAYAADRRSYPAGVESLEPARLQALVVDRLAGRDPRLRRMIAESDPATVAPVPLHSMPALAA